MKESTSKEKVLKRVRNALINKSQDAYADVDFDSQIYKKSDEPLEIIFAERFTALNGKFAFCEDENEFIEIISDIIKSGNLGEPFCLEDRIKNILKKGNISFSDIPDNVSKHKLSLTLCESLVARTGSVMISSKQAAGRRAPVFADTHIVVAFTSQLVEDIKDAIKNVRDKYGDKTPSLISLITGPSRTADIEKTLVLGAHGPKEIYVLLIDDGN